MAKTFNKTEYLYDGNTLFKNFRKGIAGETSSDISAFSKIDADLTELYSTTASQDEDISSLNTKIGKLEEDLDNIDFSANLDIASQEVDYTPAESIQDLESGDTVAVLFGKLHAIKRGLGELAYVSGVRTDDINDNVVTNTKMATMGSKTIKGNNSNSIASPKDLSVTELKAMLNYAASDVGALDSDGVDSAITQAFEKRPTIHVSTNPPENTDGKNGDIWFQYED